MIITKIVQMKYYFLNTTFNEQKVLYKINVIFINKIILHICNIINVHVLFDI